MTTVAFFCMREPGHFQRMRSLIAGVKGLGIEAHVFTHADFRAQVEQAGGTFVDLFAKYPPNDVRSLPVPCRHVSFAGHHAEAVAKDLVGKAQGPVCGTHGELHLNLGIFGIAKHGFDNRERGSSLCTIANEPSRDRITVLRAVQPVFGDNDREVTLLGH